MTPADRRLLATLVATVRTIARTPADRPCVQTAAGRLDAAAEAADAEARGPDRLEALTRLVLAIVPGGYTPLAEVERLRAAVALAASNAQAAADHEAWLDGEVAAFAGPDMDWSRAAWRATVRDLYDDLHFTKQGDGFFDGNPLAKRLIAFIEDRHPGYFNEAIPPAEPPDTTPPAPGPIGTAAPDKPMQREPWEAVQRRAMEALAAHIAHPAHQSLADGVSGPGCPGAAGGVQGAVEPPDGQWRDWETDPPPERVAIEVRRDGLVLWRVVGLDSAGRGLGALDAADGSGEVERL